MRFGPETSRSIETRINKTSSKWASKYTKVFCYLRTNGTKVSRTDVAGANSGTDGKLQLSTTHRPHLPFSPKQLEVMSGKGKEKHQCYQRLTVNENKGFHGNRRIVSVCVCARVVVFLDRTVFAVETRTEHSKCNFKGEKM